MVGIGKLGVAMRGEKAGSVPHTSKDITAHRITQDTAEYTCLAVSTRRRYAAQRSLTAQGFPSNKKYRPDGRYFLLRKID